MEARMADQYTWDNHLKAAMFLAAGSGWKRPEPDTDAGRKLAAFTDPASSDYDEEFTNRIVRVGTAWFPETGQPALSAGLGR
jgi:hypothetical protein